MDPHGGSASRSTTERAAPGGVAGSRRRDDVLVMADGYRLPSVSWEPMGSTSATLIAVHAFGDFRLAFEEVGPALARRGLRVHAYDQRGFGDTDGRGRWHGYRRLVRDLRRVIELLRPSDRSPMFLLGESLGGGVALVAAARFRPEGVAGLVLVEPAVRRGVRWRLMWDVAFGTLALVAPGYSRRLTRGVHPRFTPIARQRLGHDPRIVRFIRADAYKGLLSLAAAASSGTRRLRLPTLFLYGRADGVIPLKLFERAVTDLDPLVTAIRYPDAPHLLLHTDAFEEVLDDVAAWLGGDPLPASEGGLLLRAGPRPGAALGPGSPLPGRKRRF